MTRRRPYPRLAGLAAGAILLRWLLFLGRGDYIAFDEGWYLLLGRSWWTGAGYQLIGLPHITLSPVFPIVAGAVGRVVGDWVLGGRLVAAVASGVLVVPVWVIVRHLASASVAWAVAGLVAVLPAMAPFVAAYWIGADLWVGAEPFLHLGVYGCIAAWCLARTTGHLRWWLLGGVAGASAFLSRPEGLLVPILLASWSLGGAMWQRSIRDLRGVGAFLAAFLLLVGPYWIHLHAVTGQWRLTGREVDQRSLARVLEPGHESAAADIERMLSEDDGAYEARLFGLDPSGLRMRSAYWGVDTGAPRPGSRVAPAPIPQAAAPASPTKATVPSAVGSPRSPIPTIGRSARQALSVMIPVWCWPLVFVGVIATARARRSRDEAVITFALLGTSLGVAWLAAIDARTQLFLVPLLALWVVRGIDAVATMTGARVATVRPVVIRGILLSTIILTSLGIHAWRLRMSLTVGSPHHIVGRQNRLVGEALDSLLDGRPGPIASWHPAIALFADRAWRPLPLASFSDIVRYEQGSGAAGIVLSAYYPPTRGQEIFEARYAVFPVPEAPRGPIAWGLRPVTGDSLVVLSVAVPADSTVRERPR